MADIQQDPKFVLHASRQFGEWLAATGGSLVFTTYQAGKLFLLGTDARANVSLFERSFRAAWDWR